MAFDQRNIDAFRVLISGSGSYCTRGRFRVLFAYHNPDIPEEKHGAELRHRRTAERLASRPFFRAFERQGRSGQLSILHHRAEHGHRTSARPAPGPACRAFQPERRIPAVVEFVDIAGLVAGASKGEGLGNKFLANIRECDAIAHVVRCFEDGDVTHVGGQDLPGGRHRDHRDRADAGRSRQLGKARRRHGEEGQGRRQGSQGDAGAHAARLGAAARGQARPPHRGEARGRARLRHAGPDDRQAGAVRLQCGRASAKEGNALSAQVFARAKEEGAKAVVVSAKIESEIAVLPLEDQRDYLDAIELEEPGLNRVIRAWL